MGDESPGAGKFIELRGRLLRSVDDVATLDADGCKPCRELKEKLEANAFNLVVVGQFKRGKTHLINALMGADILPVSVIPLTSIVTVMTFGETLASKVFFNDGSVREIDRAELAEYVTEAGNPNNEKDVREVVISYPSSYLKDGVRLIDTPGVGSVFIHNTDVAYKYLPKSDAALFLLSVDQPVSRAELDFLKDVRQYADKIFFLLNKIDYLSESEIDEAIRFSRGAIEEALGNDVRIFPVSAKLALNGKLEGSEGILRKSCLPAFSEALDEFLLHEKGKVLLLSGANSLLRILSQAEFEMELQLKSLTTPLEDLKEKIAGFEVKKGEILAEKKDFDVLLNSEIDRLVRKVLDEDLSAFKKKLIPEMERGFDEFCSECANLSLKELNDALETYVTEGVEKAFTAWRLEEDEKLGDEFERVCGRFAANVNGIIDTLLDFSSQLFSVPFRAVKAESVWTVESNLYYKLREEPVGLDMFADSLTQVLPSYIGDRFKKFKDYVYGLANRVILSKRKRHMLETIDMQAGRIRFDFLDRLGKSGRMFRAEMMKKIEAAVDGISSAVEKGLDLQSRGEKEAAATGARLKDQLARLNEIRRDILGLKATVEAVEVTKKKKPDA